MTSEIKNDKEKLPPDFRIGILGALGSGKSTVAELIGKNLQGSEVIEEKFRKNPHLAKFYKNPSMWSFHSQTRFLLDKVGQYSGLPDEGIIIIVPSVEMDRLYALTHRQMDWMTEAEWDLYQWLYGSLIKAKRITSPDIYIAVTANDDILVERIKQRATQPGRKAERWILKNYPEYPVKLARNVENWVRKKARSKPILVVDTSICDCTTSLGRIRVVSMTNNFIKEAIKEKSILAS